VHSALSANFYGGITVMNKIISAAVAVALSGCVPTSWDGLRQSLSHQISADFVAAGCPPEGTNAREVLAFIQCAEPVEYSALMRMDPAAIPRFEQYAYERRELTKEAVAGQISDAEFRARTAASGQAWRHAWDAMHSQMAGGERFFYAK
jgi:hypothetical protein